MTAETTSALYAIKLVQVLSEQGIDCTPALRRCGFTAADMGQYARTIDLTKYLRLVETAVLLSPADDLGFQVGKRTGLLEHGVLGYALLASRNLKESLHRYVRYQAVVGPLLDISLGVEGDQAHLTARPVVRDVALSDAALRYFQQEWLATWNPWSRLTGHSGPFLTAVSLGLEEQPLHASYQHHLNCAIRFEAGPVVATFPADHLGRKLQYSDARTGAFCKEQCALLLQAQQQQQGVAAEVLRRFAISPDRIPDMEQVATSLGMTSRTLRRHLKSEGTTFQETVVNHRLGLARRYLRETNLPVAEIVDLVGYADASNFYRTFGRSMGLTPAQYRAQAS